ncbi:UDP-2-acetamido-2,6-beta-L-arabino-hexul-4-ose reductase [Novilysobacter antarcticus]|uniref:UDP-2-acetamido-2,6-beta-L-arabino-hexul-4-ose reductase n=1 Tax=Novilysobacter antarcticus TaxID=2862543 RepID=UPI001C99AC15|nr:NAD-dependent epimerase/dehydratase family protein [Lysobacter antarcticus]
MKILITGADGFIGKNLRVALSEHSDMEVLAVTRATSKAEFAEAIGEADAVIHLAGVNRPGDPAEFAICNTGLSAWLCDVLCDAGRAVPIAFASSTQAERDTPYGTSKRAAEELLLRYGREAGAPVAIYRLPNVFGKWCRPNYNSVVATFCHNIARGFPIRIDDPAAPMALVYIDDVVAELVRFLSTPPDNSGFSEVSPVYNSTVGELARQIEAFVEARQSLTTERVGSGLVRALYATYVSYLPTAAFSYSIPQYADQRGVFVEMLKTKDSGQVSFFTAHPGITRGGHYHHSKTEKFLVIKGKARFRFRHVLSNEAYQVETEGAEPVIVETIPGWAHDITNIGDEDMIVMLWANEVFDRARPDTIASPV